MAWTTNDIPDLADRVAVVTGANGGLGLETARRRRRPRRDGGEVAGKDGFRPGEHRRLRQAPRTKGSCETRSRVSRRQALATAGAIGGTPGSPTPRGSSFDATIATSTSGMS
jgi:NAD(P)-dependent dehydrogenase (short-subunit alcohol dehydrogenase family)